MLRFACLAYPLLLSLVLVTGGCCSDLSLGDDERLDGDAGAEDDGAEDDGAEDDGAEDDGAEDDGAEDDGAEDDGAEDDGAEDDGAEDDGAEDDESTSKFSDYDDFDEENITWLHTDVSGWEVTSTVTEAHIDYEEVCVYHTMAGQWPEVLGIFPEEPDAPMEGNIWIIARVGGSWYAATFDYLRPGGQCKYDGYAPEDEGPGPSTFGAVPLSTWIPQPGEPVYMFMSTVARHGPLGPVHERSDYVQLIWP